MEQARRWPRPPHMRGSFSASAAVAGLPDWNGRIVIDANNPVEAPLFKPVDLQGLVSSQVIAELVKGARLVKAFNHLRADVLASGPRTEGAVACCSTPAMTTARRPRLER